MRPTLVDEITVFLEKEGPSTTETIALGVRARRDDVDEALRSPGRFTMVERPEGGNPRARYFAPSRAVRRRAKTLGRATAMLAVLSDGREHSREEILERANRPFFLTNNAAADLRKQGYDIQHRVEDGLHLYRLAGYPQQAAA